MKNRRQKWDERDKYTTIANRGRLLRNYNLLYWYKKLFKQQIGSDRFKLKILEIGSGTSPIKYYFPNVITSDVMDLPYIDLIFDCHSIHSNNEIENESLDLIVMTNVLHHLIKPLAFIENAACKLKKGGCIVATEPYFSLVSRMIYQYLHYEDVDYNIKKPVLANAEKGPLSSSNMALPYIIFFKNKLWIKKIESFYYICKPEYFTFLSYFITGGISNNIPFPKTIYKALFPIDRRLSSRWPSIFASFFTIRLVKT